MAGLLGHREWEAGEIERSRALLDGIDPAARQWEWRFLDQLPKGAEPLFRAFDQYPVLAVRYTPDGSLLAIAGSTPTIYLWDVEKRVVVRTLECGVEEVGFGAFLITSDGSRIIRAGRSVASCWDLAAGQRLCTTRFQPDPEEGIGNVRKVAIGPDGESLVTVSYSSTEGSVTRWDLRTNTATPLLETQCWYPDAAWSADGNTQAVLAWPDQHQSVVLFADRGRTKHAEIVVEDFRPEHIAFAPDGNSFALADYDGDIRLVDVTSGLIRLRISGTTKTVRSMSISADNDYIAVESIDGGVHVWCLKFGALIRAFAGAAEGPNRGHAFSPDSFSLAEAVSEKSCLSIWYGNLDDRIGRLRTDVSIRPRVLEFSPNSESVAVG